MGGGGNRSLGRRRDPPQFSHPAVDSGHDDHLVLQEHAASRLRDRALFDLAIDSKLRGCGLVQIKIGDLVSGGQIRTYAIVMQQKTGGPVQFELLPDARASLLAWLDRRGGTVDDYVFPSRVDHNGHLSTRQYARLVHEWVTGVGLM